MKWNNILNGTLISSDKNKLKITDIFVFYYKYRNKKNLQRADRHREIWAKPHISVPKMRLYIVCHKTRNVCVNGHERIGENLAGVAL